MSSSSDRFRWGVIAAAAAILVYQLFIPPIVGLADQGDFGRVIARFGYGREDTSIVYANVEKTYVLDPKARVPGLEQACPEYVLVGAAVLLNLLISKDGKLDIVVMGLVHAVVFLAVFAWLLRATQAFFVHRLLWIAALLVLTDVGYAAYWNSFFAEPSSHILFLLLLAESILILREPQISTAQLCRWCAWAPGTGFYEILDSGAIGRRTTSATVGRFYLLHPLRIWRRAKRVLPIAFSLRPEWCGNFEREAGYPPGARSRAFSLWSVFHERLLARCGKLILLLLVAAPIVFLAAWIRFPSAPLRIEFAAALSLCCLIAFMVPALGDAWDTVKHMVLFNLLLDTGLICALGLICSRVTWSISSNSLLKSE